MLSKFIKSWYVEIIFLLLLIGLLASVIFAEAFNQLLEVYFKEWLTGLKAWFGSIAIPELGRSFVHILGYSLVGLIGLLLIVWRIGWRLQKSPKWTSVTCPSCNYPLVRLNRTPMQRVISKLLPLRRLYCKHCGWRGIRLRGTDSATTSITNRPQPPKYPIDKIYH